MTKKDFSYKGVKIQISENNYKFQKNKHVFDRLKQGSYEREEIQLMLKRTDPKAVVLDLGASLGILSCVIGNSLNDSSNMVSVEANPNLLEDLKNNRDINNLKYKVLHAAVSSKNKDVEFNFNGLSLSGSIFKKKHLLANEKSWGEYKSIKMKTVTPLDIEEKTGLKFDTLSCDIEGEELALLPDMIDYFKKFKLLVVEFHEIAEKDHKHSIRQVHQIYSNFFNIEKIRGVTCFYK